MEPVPELRLVFWETTAGCNLQCIHCRRLDVARHLMRDDLTTDEGRALIDAIAEAGRPILVLSGGEALFRPDLFELVQHAVARELPVSLATNGTLVTDDVAERVATSGIRRVAVSVDGPDAATHDNFRKQAGAFDGAVNALRRLRARGMSTQINTTVTRHNAHLLDAIYALALELGADAFHTFLLVPVGCGLAIAESKQLPPEEYERVLHWLWERSREGRIHAKATCAPHYFRVMRQRSRAEGVRVERAAHGMSAVTRGCLAGTGVCFVSHKGEVYPCGYLPVSAGNVRRERFADLWADAPVFRALRRTEDLGGKCGACEYRRICSGCRARAYSATRDYMAEEPFCVYQPKPLAAAGARGPDSGGDLP
ncbi:MAG: radical SAM protein [Planctomycetes bacterium]|nr:radical SAM protein [Planctomycetota bacterium]